MAQCCSGASAQQNMLQCELQSVLLFQECFHRGRAQKNDESYYFTAMRFFMEFNRNYNFQVKYVRWVDYVNCNSNY